jgi:serine/threonine protein phosphatase PrpC
VGRIAAAVTAVFSAGNDLFVALVGHCRCYLFRGGMLTQLTRDQTLRADLASTLQPTPVARALKDDGVGRDHRRCLGLEANASGAVRPSGRAALANGGTVNVTVVLANDHIPSPREYSK